MSRITLVPRTRAGALADLERLSPSARREVSPNWLARVQSAADDDPWAFGFSIREHATGAAVGTCGFKAPPADGVVEIAYGVLPEREGRGFATEAAAAMVALARDTGQVRLVRAHTVAESNASTRVLQKNGFRLVGPVIDPEDGEVWRWELSVEYAFSWDSTRLQFDRIHAALAASYWSPGISREAVERAAAGSLVLGAYRRGDGQQIAYARVITDRATIAYLSDLIVFEGHRAAGLGKAMVREILVRPDLQTVRRFLLATRDAHGLYRPFGFGPLVADRWMERPGPGAIPE